MRARSIAVSSALLISVSWLVACSPPPSKPKPAETEHGEKADADPVKDESKSQANADGAEKPTTDADGVLVSQPSIEGGTPPIRTPKWKLVHSGEQEVILSPTRSGILATVAGAAHQQADDGSLVRVEKFSTSKDPALSSAGGVLGNWPGDAWRLERSGQDGAKTTRAAFRWQSGRWHRDSTAVGNDGIVRASGRGGLLVARDADGTVEWVRLGSELSPPVGRPLAGARLLDHYESTDGRVTLFLVESADDAHRALRIESGCPATQTECAPAVAIALRAKGPDAEHAVGPVTERKPGTLSAAVEVRPEPSNTAEVQRHIVHFDGDDWRLEDAPRKLPIAHMVGSPGGGLWVHSRSTEMATQLWYRGADGHWVTVRLPSNVAYGDVTFAARDDGNVWVAGSGDGKFSIYEASIDLE